jgi:hypothetical protein
MSLPAWSLTLTFTMSGNELALGRTLHVPGWSKLTAPPGLAYVLHPAGRGKGALPVGVTIGGDGSAGIGVSAGGATAVAAGADRAGRAADGTGDGAVAGAAAVGLAFTGTVGVGVAVADVS